MALTEKLTAIADAVRARTGETGQISLDEIATKIADISDLKGFIDRTAQTIRNTDVRSVGTLAFYQYTALQSVEFPNVTTVYGYAFNNCSNLSTASMPKLESVYGYAFNGCTKLENVSFPLLTGLGSNAFQKCVGLTRLDFPKLTSVQASVFEGCTALTEIILRKTSLCALSNVNAFLNTPFRNGEGGTVYVPQALLSQYQSATNWSTLESTTFLPIEGSAYENAGSAA